MEQDNIQEFLVELDTFNLLERYLKLAIPTVLESTEELAVKIVNRREKYLSLHLPAIFDQKKHFPVIFISGWLAPKDGKPNRYFNGYPKWETFKTVEDTIEYVERILKQRRKSWSYQFEKKFGDGYNDGFNRFDGSIGVGLRLQSCRSSPEWLAISLIHFYYGK